MAAWYPARATLPVLTNVLLEADPGDGLRLVATNLDLTVSRRVRATVSTAGRTTVPARLLADYVALLDRGKQVSLNLSSSGHKLHLACDRLRGQHLHAASRRLSSDARHRGSARSVLKSMVLCSRPPSSRWFSPLRLTTLGRFWRAFCCDSRGRPVDAGGCRWLSARDRGPLSLTDTTTRAAWIVPARTLVEVAHSLPSTPGLPVTLSGTAGDHQLHAALGDVEISSRLIDGQFPDYERIIPSDSATSVILGTADLLHATRVAARLRSRQRKRRTTGVHASTGRRNARAGPGCSSRPRVLRWETMSAS